MSASRSWFEIQNKAGAAAAQIFIYDEIGLFGVTPADFREQLAEIPDDREIELHVHSPGGSVFDGLVIYDDIARRSDRVTGFNDGVAASMATVLLCACKKVVMAENGWFMIHEAEGGAVGRADKVQRAAKIISVSNDQIAAIYAARTGKPETEVRAKMTAETWFTAKEAKDFGFVDEIAPAVDMTAKTTFFDRFKNGPKPGSDPKPEDKPSTAKTHPLMKKLLTAMVEAQLISSADLAEDAAIAEFKANFESAQEELTTLRNTAKTLAQTEAETAVDAAIADKRIVIAETDTEKKLRAMWIKNYVANPTDTKAMLGAMKPVAVEAPAQPGRKPIQIKGAADAPISTDTDALWAQYNSIKDPKAKTLFFRENIKPVLAKAGAH